MPALRTCTPRSTQARVTAGSCPATFCAIVLTQLHCEYMCVCVHACVCVCVYRKLCKCTEDSLSVSAGSKVEGQIYIPVVNWLLGLLTLACVLIFRSNTAIGNGFGEQSPNFPFTALCLISVDYESVQELGSHGMCCCNVSWLHVCTT